MVSIVELDLGLLDNAVLKFEQVLENSSNSNSRYSASYGFASCHLLAANQYVEEGKFGAALQNLCKGIESLSCLLSGDTYVKANCVLKLLGDLYSHGYKVPSSTFDVAMAGVEEEKKEFPSTKIEFLIQGELIYMQLLQKVEAEVDIIGDTSMLTAALNDVGTIILLQANLKGATIKQANAEEGEEVNSLLIRSKEFFLRAIQSNGLDSFAWLGLGCAMCSLDNLLSQHALCRALQIDKNLVDAWVNLSFIYGEMNKLNASEASIDMLTQIGDTPLMWIARGLLIEKCSKEASDVTEKRQSAADAYRACLQTSRNPVALLGLGLNCRWLGLENSSNCDGYRSRAKYISQKESEASLSMYLTSCKVESPIAKFIHTIITDEHVYDNTTHCDGETLDKVLTASDTINGQSSDDRSMTIEQTTIKNAQQMVKQNPDDGKNWLRLAKLLTMSFTNLKNPSKQSRELLLDAVERAKYILKAAVTEPVILQATVSSSNTRKSMISSPVEATQLSDAYALSYWINHDHNEHKNDSHDLQRALLLDPENRYARAKLDI